MFYERSKHFKEIFQKIKETSKNIYDIRNGSIINITERKKDKVDRAIKNTMQYYQTKYKFYLMKKLKSTLMLLRIKTG